IHEETRRSPLDRFIRRGAPSLDRLRYALEFAAVDPEVRAIVVEIGNFDAGLATAHEIHRLLRAAHSAGKRVIALVRGDIAGLREYLAAAGAGEIVANPGTAFALYGVATGGVFLKNALDKVKIQAQTLQWKEYKGAGETLSRAAMSPALRESMAAVVADWEKILVEAIAPARKLSPERTRELLAAGFVSAQAAIETGLADREGYREDLRAELDPEGHGLPFVDLGRYFRHAAHVRERGRRARIALIHASGPVIAGEAPAAGEYIDAAETAELMDRASRDERVRAIVFRVNSPGGSAVGSDLVWRSVKEARRRGKPVIVSMGDVAGSGGYYVAAGADAIVAEAASITGSIGVVYAKINFAGALAALGVGVEFVKSAENSDAMAWSRPLTEAELAQVNDTLGHLYETFTARVAEGRKLPLERAEALARGRIWSGLKAREVGLVDEIGGLQTAIEIARIRGNLGPGERHRIVAYRGRHGWPGLAGALGFSAASPPWPMRAIARAAGIPVRWAPAMAEALVRGGAMLLCPWFEL
ncbi:MAG: signal peptide peptidase SppA, partial [Candidatus Binataceae bacterium]